jgi:type I restriction enzyme S subunit
MQISDLIEFNPKRVISRGSVAPFVDMASVPELSRDIAQIQEREFKGSGSRFQNGDTIFARITPCLENGKTSLVSGLPHNTSGHGSTEFIVMAAKDPDNDMQFVYYLARSPEFRSYAIQKMEGTSGRQRVSWQSLSEYQTHLPPKNERKAIGKFLSSLDDRIALLRETNATLEAIAQAIFKSWFVDFDPVHAKAEGRLPEGMDEATAALFPDGFEESELGLIPRGWRATTLAESSSYLKRGLSPKYIDEGGVLVLNQKCIRDFSVDTSKARRHDSTHRKTGDRELLVGDVLVNSTGVGTLGRVAQMLRLTEPTVVDSHVTVVRAGDNLSWPYLGQLMMHKQPEIEAMGEGSTGQTELSRSKLGEVPLVTPTPVILSAFDSLVTPLKHRIAINDEKFKTLADLRDTLLPRLISGKLRLPECQNGTEEITA